MKKTLLSSALTLVLVTSTSLNVNAAILDVSQLNIEAFSLSLDPSGVYPTINIADNYSPAQVWNMGEYGVFSTAGSFEIPLFGSVSYIVESTGDHGAPPPNGFVDTTAGTIDLNFSSLYMSTSGVFVGEGNLWNPSTSTIDFNFYNHNDGAFHFAWSDIVTLQDNAFGAGSLIDVNYTIEFTGTADVVPVPPAVWLFVSGLAGLFGISRYKNNA